MLDKKWMNWTEEDWASWLEQKLSNRQKSYEYTPEGTDKLTDLRT